MQTQQITYVNAFRTKGYSETQTRTFTSSNSEKRFEYRGMSVYKTSARCFNYVYDGVCITQRVGFSKDYAIELADRFLANDQGYDIQRAISVYCRGKGIAITDFNPSPSH